MVCALALSFVSCSTDFEVNDKPKEIDIVYGLLDAGSAEQYIKINKAFLNTNGAATDLAKDKGNLFHLDSLEVSLIPVTNGNPGAPVRLQRVAGPLKDSGTFDRDQYLWKYSQPLNTDIEYILEVKNPATGHIVTGRTSIVGAAKPSYPSTTTILNFPADPLLSLAVNFNAGKNAYTYDIILELNYTDISLADSNVRESHRLVWPWRRNVLTNSTAGGADVRNNLKTEEIISYLKLNVPEKEGIRRRFESVTFHYNGATQDFYTYQQVYAPNSSIATKRQDFSNVNNGYGLFTSRNLYSITRPINKASRELLKLRLPGLKWE